jgi:HK97 gp10 family phage protein
MGEAFTMSLNLGDLKAFTTSSKEKIKAAVRPAAQAGAQVLYDATKANVSRLGRKPGTLAASIYQAYAAEKSSDSSATYVISWNKKKAPHGHLVEFGHIQRYKAYIGKDGKWHTAIRKSQQGKLKPKRGAPQAVKDAYYVPLDGGPRLVAAQPFLRTAIAEKSDEVLQAMRAEFAKRLA